MGTSRLFAALIALGAMSSSPAHASDLAELAASMEPNTWAELETLGLDINGVTNSPGINGDYFRSEGNAASNTLQYMGRGFWDEARGRLYFKGGGHFSAAHMHIYTEADNTWSYGAPPAHIGGHGYNQNAWDLDRGYSYLVSFDNHSRYNIDSNTWTQVAGPPINGPMATSEIYYPNLDRIVLENPSDGTLWLYDQDADSWSRFTEEAYLSCHGDGDGGYYHSFVEYSPVDGGLVLFGGGNTFTAAFSNRWCSVDENGVVTQMPDAPEGTILRVPDSNPREGALINIDMVSGDLFALSQTGIFHRFEFESDTWTEIDDASTRPALFSADGDGAYAVTNSVVINIPTHGVNLYARFRGAETAAWLFKIGEGTGEGPGAGSSGGESGNSDGDDDTDSPDTGMTTSAGPPSTTTGPDDGDESDTSLGTGSSEALSGDDTEGGEGCSCTHTGKSPWSLAGLLFAPILGARRRRRTTTRSVH